MRILGWKEEGMGSWKDWDGRMMGGLGSDAKKGNQFISVGLDWDTGEVHW